VAALLVPVAAVGATRESTCFGSVSNGALENACELPSSGMNFSAYSTLGRTLGRTYVHCRVSEIVTAAYEELAKTQSSLRFVYGETGLEEGGEIDPHRTHQNGLSVDFMVPVRNEKGAPVPLPTHLLNKWGYAIEFDGAGRSDDLRIDFEAIASHLGALARAAKSQGVGIAKVIFDPSFQPMLRKAKAWSGDAAGVPLSPSASWIRHDEHYHVDFAIPCKPLR
jgi:penicillin-insensitive murein endopeptidase